MNIRKITNCYFLKVLFFFSCLFLKAAFFGFAQNKTIFLYGVIKNTQDERIEGATIIAKQGVFIKAFDISKKEGTFQLSLNIAESYTIEISSIGYNKLEATKLINQENRNWNFTLIQKTTSEDTVRITAKRSIYEKGDTIFYNADAFKNNNENNLKDLLNNMPGITVMPNGKIFADGQVVEKVLIDGKDLTGENYEKIVNNLSPHGLDQIQVLKKYKDPFELSNSATGNTEVAINLTFKNKKIIPNAKVSTNIGNPLKYYEQKADFLILTKPVTAINFINLNTIGNTAQLITSPNSLFTNFNIPKGIKIGKGLQYQNGVNELFIKLSKEFYTFNNTKYFDNSSQFNIGKTITNKFSINYTPEKIKQTESNFNKIFIDNQVIAESNSLENPIINKQNFAVNNELIWMLKKNEQIKWNMNFIKSQELSTNYKLLNLSNINLVTENNKNFISSLINYTKFLKNATIINYAIFYDNQKNNEGLINNGVKYNNIIVNSNLGTVNEINQKIKVLESNVGTYLKIVKRKNDHSFTIQPTYKKVFGNFYSNLSANTNSNTYYNIDSFANLFKYIQNSISVPLQYKYQNIKDFIIGLSFEPFVNVSEIHKIQNNFLNFNSSFNISYEFKNSRRISFNTSRFNDFSFLSKMFVNNVFVNNVNKFTNTRFLLKQNSYNFNLNSFKPGSFNLKPNFSYQLFTSINTPNFLLNSQNNNFYSVQNYISYTFSNLNNTVVIKNNFTLNNIKLRFENDFSVQSRTSNNSQNNVIISSLNKGFQINNRIISRFPNSINFQLKNNLSFANNKRKNTNFTNKSVGNTTELLLNFNYKKKSHIDISINNFYFKTPNQTAQKIFLCNISYKQLLNKNKIRLNVELSNVTNKKAFISQNISITQFSQNEVLLLPFIALAKLEFLL